MNLDVTKLSEQEYLKVLATAFSEVYDTLQTVVSQSETDLHICLFCHADFSGTTQPRIHLATCPIGKANKILFDHYDIMCGPETDAPSERANSKGE